MKKLLVGSVAIDGPRSKHWYDIQMSFLEKTTEDFDHCLYVNGRENHYNRSFVITYASPAESIAEQKANHLQGLKILLEYFKVKSNEYENFLILDSDCFPIKKNWLNELISKGFDSSAIVRYENLDTFPHPSAVFIKKSYLWYADFSLMYKINLLGHIFEEVVFNAENFFPLIRTNKINYHPVMYGVYYNMFYHHGAGSRELKFRSINGIESEDNKKYYYDFNNLKIKENAVFDLLKDDPDKFINDLTLLKDNVKIL